MSDRHKYRVFSRESNDFFFFDVLKGESTQLRINDTEVLMQSPARRDKENTLIYEGDILDTGKYKGVVIFREYDDGEGYGCDSHLGWLLEFKEIGRIIEATIPDIHKTSKIIGNIHMHPERLEAQS